MANRLAYDALADEYRKRAAVDRIKDIPLIAPFVSYLTRTFGRGCRVLDIGPGNGVNLEMFHEAGLNVVGVDISPEMLEVAKENCPDAELHLGDFLEVPFAPGAFHGVFAKASLHLLPKAEALRAIRKVHDILVKNGMFYITSTVEYDSEEGYFAKADYPGQLTRFRKHWRPGELSTAVAGSGFVIYKDSYDFEADWRKQWYNIWATKE